MLESCWESLARPQDWCRGGPGTGVVRVKDDCGCGFWWQEWEAWGRRLLQIAWFLGLVTWVVAPQLPGKACSVQMEISLLHK